MLVLQPKEVCPFSLKCPYVKNHNYSNSSYPCRGMDPNRQYVFKCEFVKENGRIEGGYQRNSKDLTGKMKILVE